jgi:hypothetical protein
MRWCAAVVFIFGMTSFGQDSGTARIWATLKAGAGAGKLALAIAETPASGDRIVISTDTSLLKSVPTGLTAILQGANLRVTASDEVAPGRYYIRVEATAGKEHDSGEVVVDAVREVAPGPARK